MALLHDEIHQEHVLVGLREVGVNIGILSNIVVIIVQLGQSATLTVPGRVVREVFLEVGKSLVLQHQETDDLTGANLARHQCWIRREQLLAKVLLHVFEQVLVQVNCVEAVVVDGEAPVHRLLAHEVLAHQCHYAFVVRGSRQAHVVLR